jgi:uncharacterized protein (TIGR02265 family)
MYEEPDWSKPVDFSARVAAIPEGAVIRGMFLTVLWDALTLELNGKLRARRYVAFKNYPMREYVELLGFATEQARSNRPADYMRRLGRLIYPNYVKTISGSAIFAVAGHDFGRVIEASPTAYKVGLSPASIVVRRIERNHAQVELRNVYNLPEFHQVGIWEGAMKVCGVSGTIKTRVIDFGAADFDVHWESYET